MLTRLILALIASVGLWTPSASQAESAAPFGDAAGFLDLPGVECPAINGNTKCFDPTAGGAKIFGTLTVVFDKVPNACPSNASLAFVKNMYVNFTMDQGGLRVPFSTDYLNGPPAHQTGFCFNSQRPEQVKVIVSLVKDKIVPFFFNCEANCPAFRVKSISNYQYTTGHPSLAPYPYSGGFSADIVIALPER